MAYINAIVRLKRWSSKEEREQQPDWLNPGLLTTNELVDLGTLLGRDDLRISDFEAADKAGTVMAVLRTDDTGTIRIKAYASMTVAILPGQRIGWINECSVSEDEEVFEIVELLKEKLTDIGESLGVNVYEEREPEERPMVRRSYTSEIEQAERLDNLQPDRAGKKT